MNDLIANNIHIYVSDIFTTKWVNVPQMLEEKRLRNLQIKEIERKELSLKSKKRAIEQEKKKIRLS